MRFELINPSDPIEVECETFDIAAIACVVLGEGNYALEPLDDGRQKVPLFLFGGSQDWFLEQFKKTPDELIVEILGDPVRRESLASCLDAVRIKGHPTKAGSDNARSSMNDICGRAWKIAGNVRAYGRR